MLVFSFLYQISLWILCHVKKCYGKVICFFIRSIYCFASMQKLLNKIKSEHYLFLGCVRLTRAGVIGCFFKNYAKKSRIKVPANFTAQIRVRLIETNFLVSFLFKCFSWVYLWKNEPFWQCSLNAPSFIQVGSLQSTLVSRDTSLFQVATTPGVSLGIGREKKTGQSIARCFFWS